jgi:prepilin-type N-terminal cleavage/methylation domain-containing protein
MKKSLGRQGRRGGGILRRVQDATVVSSSNVGGAGFSLLEVMIAMSVLAVAAFGLMAAFSSVVRMREVTEQEIFAANAIRDRLAQVRADARADSADGFSQMIENYLDNPDYNTFAVEGIDREGSRSGVIELHLTENAIPAGFGLPDGSDGLNLDDDDTISSADLADSGSFHNIRLVPVEARVSWTRPGGVAMEMKRFLLVARKSAD